MVTVRSVIYCSDLHRISTFIKEPDHRITDNILTKERIKKKANTMNQRVLNIFGNTIPLVGEISRFQDPSTLFMGSKNDSHGFSFWVT